MPLPFPVRIAAGLVATAVEQARDFPRLVIEFPVTAVSQALQASMRVQQRVTELAIKGDRVLGTLRPAEEKPSWATFDEDEPPGRNGTSRVTELRPAGRPTAPPDAPPEPEPVDTETVATEVPAAEPPVAEAVTETVITHTKGPEVVTAETLLTDAEDAEAEVTEPPVERRAEPPAELDDDGIPPALPDYANMSIPQLRGKLRFLSLEDLQSLLEWETAHGERPPFLTMLGNRITTVVEG